MSSSSSSVFSAFVSALPAGSSILFLSEAEGDESQLQPLPAGVAVTTLKRTEHSKISGSEYSSRFDAIITPAFAPYAVSFSTSLVPCLKPAGTLLLSLPSTSSAQDAQTNLILSGFVDAEINTQTNNPSFVLVQAKRPPWSSNASAPLKLKKKSTPAVQAVPTQTTSKDVWSLGADDTIEADLADEDELLAADKVTINSDILKKADCGTGSGPTRKACKNCSCGLAEELAKQPVAGAAPAKPVSSCGSCGLGDAFRCSTCPYLGQPAWDTSKGDVLKLKM